jgi:hypothetical protein
MILFNVIHVDIGAESAGPAFGSDPSMPDVRATKLLSKMKISWSCKPDGTYSFTAPVIADT